MLPPTRIGPSVNIIQYIENDVITRRFLVTRHILLNVLT